MSGKHSDVLDQIRRTLKNKGIDLETCCSENEPDVKLICLESNLGRSLAEVGSTARDQVVMVRLDKETSKLLDDWTATGAVKSRSEAAALFIREGLRIRTRELEQLRGALDQVEEARKRLREQARTVLGNKD